MIWLMFAGLVYLLALYGTLFLVQASNNGEPVLALFVALVTAILWVTSMYLIFRGLVEIGVFDVLKVPAR